MPLALRELQRAFRAATYSGEPPAELSACVVEAGLSVEVRLGLYRHNTLSNLYGALEADYPVLQQLVGAEFFRHAALSHIAATPSTSGDIGDYGEGFPEFIAAFAPAASLPYLGDVARLERAWKQSFFAAEADAVDFSTLAGLPAERLGDLHLRPHPALRLLSSPYPVLRIWQANQPDAADTEIRLDAGGDWLLLRRVDTQVEMRPLPAAEYTWLVALMDGGNLSAAVDAAFSIQDDFALAPCLQRHIAQGDFVTYSLGEPP